jgi:RimJ/RimL family protein N-acetyltransferase
MYKILIRPLDESDALISWKWRNDPEVWKYTGNRPDVEITEKIEVEWINKVLSESTSRRFSITIDDLYVGNVQLTNITDFDAEYHIFIGNKNYWGKGVSRLATNQILYYAKEVLGLKSIYLKYVKII